MRERLSSTIGTLRRHRWRVALLVTIGFVVAAFFPGRLVPDTLDMCNQAITDRYTDWHSPVLAGLWGFFDAPVGLIFVAQTVAFVLAVGALLRPYLRPAAVWVAATVVSLNPATLSWLAHVGKDQWFCVFALWTVAWLGAASRQSESLRRRRAMVFAMCCAWFAVASRGNAAAAIVGAALPFASTLTPARLTTRFRRWRLPLAWTWVLGIVVIVLASVQAWSSTVVQPSHKHVEQATMSFDLAGISERTDELLVPELLLVPGATLADVERVFDARAGEAWFFQSDSPLRYPVFNRGEIAQLRSAWVHAIFDHPVTYVRVRMSYALAQLGISGPHPGGSVNDTGSTPERWGLACDLPETALPSLNQQVNDVLAWADRSHLVRGWFFLALAAVAVAATWRQRCLEARALLGAGILNELTIAALGISATYRYVWFLAVVGQLTCALALRTTRIGIPDPATADTANDVALTEPC